ncbi:TPA: glycosyltransferase family 39 protein [Legionella pneumophila]|nr:glycosyltransferase family 39 protein [Legionella pneumophila]HDO7871724.1 glycosyltransferase family 39 protein [Legionella pneumophila]HDO7939649.1 glycosyltransferase family 39 protein [Legionella pneumophila]HDO8158699.1 glycosyltransferase family 39 protein [Legionella pneumophila]HDO9866154.1 glycosyltransferase family 39 protein [Legionella pneumophila]
MALFFPLTGDEALFYHWGKEVAFGYYDHPPVSGWISALFISINNSLFFFRIPGIVLPGLISWIIIQFTSDKDKIAGYFAASLYLLLPVNLLSIYTNDTPLVFFVMLSALFINKAVLKNNLIHWMLGGIFLGLALLTKYIAAILFFAYIFYFAFYQRKYIYLFVFSLLFSLPFVACNITYNYFNCGNNIMFNLINRNSDSNLSMSSPILYFFTLAYFVPPYILWKYFRNPKNYTALIKNTSKFSFTLMAISLGLFGFISIEKRVGLHWVLAFIPFVFIVIAQAFSINDLKKSINYSIIFLLLNLCIFLIFLIAASQNNRTHFYFHPQEVLTKITNPSFILMTESYSKSMVLTYYYQKYIPVFGLGSYHARQDDIEFDFSSIKGKNIRTLTTKEPKIDYYQPFFKSVKKNSFRIGKVQYWLIDGYQFNYEEYENKILQLIIKKYYQFPGWLTQVKCEFKTNIMKHVMP